MKKIILLGLIVTSSYVSEATTKFKILTVVESVVKAGLGRSRILESKEPLDATKFTTLKAGGKEVDKNDDAGDRSDMKGGKYTETLLLNIYSVVGINFSNLASNDAMVVSRLEALSLEGWELFNISSTADAGIAESGNLISGTSARNGIFMTRYYLKKNE